MKKPPLVVLGKGWSNTSIPELSLESKLSALAGALDFINNSPPLLIFSGGVRAGTSQISEAEATGNNHLELWLFSHCYKTFLSQRN